MSELVDDHRKNETKPNGEGRGNILIYSRDQEKILGSYRLCIDEKAHECREDKKQRNNDAAENGQNNPDISIDEKKALPSGKFVKNTGTGRFDHQERTREGEGVWENIVFYDGVAYAGIHHHCD